MDVRTSARVSSTAPRDEAALPIGPSTKRRTATLVAFAKAISIVDMTVRATMNRPAMRSSVPLNIEIFAANGVRWLSSLHYPFRGHIPSGVAIRGEQDGGHSFQS